ncbi:thiol-disulfide oxidoreductase DCC family protein [uncultured Tenacibaculum sp.]|uniref:thiol-disulfide oxidoreductase DCC family protein n=1 Tax=uncultured Tenacibaculum sp. TaxID=174713 RepID=UPI0026369A7F|nr:DUF393 domain-containing protein [uncultured Tenacibaculum sp.]
METKTLLNKYILVLYDGDCGFCNQSILFLLQKNPSDKLRFIAQQSDTGKELRTLFNINTSLDSILLIEENIVYTKANGFLRILKHLNSKWKYLSYLKYTPSFISNTIYDLIAKYRHQFLRKKCKMLTPKEREYFI